jgi:nuclear transport factor 2 (NTF2) superfamily protein
MSQCEEGEFSFERDRYDRWLKSLGGDENVRRIRRVTFGVEWPSYNEGGEWHRRRGDVRVCIVRDGLVVDRSQRIAECPAAPLERLRVFIAELMVGKVIRRGLGYDEWMAVWDKVQELMRSGWGSPY